MRPRLKIDIDEFVTVYIEHNQNDTEVATHFGICTASVYKLRKLYGLPLKRNPSKIDENEFIRLYTGDTKILDIAKKLNISRCCVYTTRNRLGLPYRNKKWERKKSNADGNST
jgi:transposase